MKSTAEAMALRRMEEFSGVVKEKKSKNKIGRMTRKQTKLGTLYFVPDAVGTYAVEGEY